MRPPVSAGQNLGGCVRVSQISLSTAGGKQCEGADTVAVLCRN